MHDVVVANGRYLGGGMKICPDAEPDDGLFDVLLIGDVTKRDFVRRCRSSTAARHLPHPKVELLRGHGRHGRRRRSRCRSSWTASSRGRRRRGSRSCPRALRLRVPA